MFDSDEKKWRLFRAWAGRNPVWCAWQVTYRCNFRCHFCHYWCDPMGQAHEPTLDDYARGAARLAGLGTLMISLAGGEPMLRPDLCDIVRQIARYHFPFVTTNGWFVTEASARELMASGVWGVSVSIDYPDAERHDRRRGMDGAWKQAWRAVELLSSARVHPHQRVNVIAVLMDDNIRDLPRLAAMARQQGSYFMVQPYGQLKTGSDRFAHNDGSVSRRLLALARRESNFLSNKWYLRRFDQFLADGIAGCRAGRSFFNIDSTGDVAVCVERRGRPVANLFRHSASVIRSRLRRKWRENPCRQCWYNCRGEVESLYNPIGLLNSLPTLLLDRGEPKKTGR